MTDPIPTKYDEDEDAMIRLLMARHGVKNYSEVVRRCVRHLGAEVLRRGPAWDWVKATAQPINHATLTREIAEYEKAHGPIPTKRKKRPPTRRGDEQLLEEIVRPPTPAAAPDRRGTLQE